MSGNLENIIIKMYTIKEEFECEELRRSMKVAYAYIDQNTTVFIDYYPGVNRSRYRLVRTT